jgi:aryl-alcohol dehydrogenase-like predicted oxidoreductase
MEQPEYNFFVRQKVESEFLPIYDLAGIGTTIWSPLASGLLTGKYNAGIPKDSRFNLPGYEWLKSEWESPAGKAKTAKVVTLGELAKKHGLPLHHMALLWCLSNPHVSTVILGASRIEQLKDNISALEARSKFSSELKDEIETVLGNKPAGPLRY